MSDRVLLKGVDAENVTKSGIVLPSKNTPERPFVYTVVAVGPGKTVDGTLQKIDLVPGDRVLVGQYAGDDIELPDDATGEKFKYKIVGADYVLAKIA